MKTKSGWISQSTLYVRIDVVAALEDLFTDKELLPYISG